MKILRTMAVVAIAAGTAVGLTGCWPFPDAPVLGVGGGCTTKGGTLKGVGTGFDASTLYVTKVARPDSDEPYPTDEYYAYGATDEHGVMTLEWPCKGDTAGKYTVSVTEVAHTDKTASTDFRISGS